MKTLLLLLAFSTCSPSNTCINVKLMESFGFHFDSNGRLVNIAQLGTEDFDVMFSKKEKIGNVFMVEGRVVYEQTTSPMIGINLFTAQDTVEGGVDMYGKIKIIATTDSGGYFKAKLDTSVKKFFIGSQYSSVYGYEIIPCNQKK